MFCSDSGVSSTFIFCIHNVGLGLQFTLHSASLLNVVLVLVVVDVAILHACYVTLPLLHRDWSADGTFSTMERALLCQVKTHRTACFKSGRLLAISQRVLCKKGAAYFNNK